MKKCFLVVSLTALCAIAISNTASAQIGTAPRLSTFTVAGQAIKVVQTMPSKSTPGTVTFKLFNESGKALEKGKSFVLALPTQDGFTYDLLTLPGIKRIPLGVGALPTLRLNTSANGVLSFSCKVVKATQPQPTNQQIFIYVN